jgi:hypothetical protein
MKLTRNQSKGEISLRLMSIENDGTEAQFSVSLRNIQATGSHTKSQHQLNTQYQTQGARRRAHELIFLALCINTGKIPKEGFTLGNEKQNLLGKDHTNCLAIKRNFRCTSNGFAGKIKNK